MRNADFPLAEKLYLELLASDPENNKIRLELSYAYYKQQKLIEAYQEANKVALDDKYNPRARALIGVSYLGAGNFERAQAYFNDSFYLTSLKEAALQQDVIDTEFIKDRVDPLALMGAAMLDYYENRPRNALVKLRRAVMLDPEEPDFVLAQAQVAARIESYKEAAEAYRRFLQIAPIADNDRRDRIVGLINFLKFLGAQKSLYVVGGKRQTVIDCRIVNDRPHFKVRVNDHEEPLNFVLDTGSGVTVISQETANRLKIKEITKGGMARAIGGDGRFPIVYGFLNSLSIGDVRVGNVPVYIRRFHNDDVRVDGYIGLAMISRFLTTLDYGNKTFSLSRQDKDKRDKEEERAPRVEEQAQQNVFPTIPLRLTTSGFLSGEVKLDGVETPLNFIIDTGATVTVVDEVAVQHYQMNRFTQTALMKVYGAAGVTENVSTLMLPKVTLGTSTQEKIMAAVLNLTPVNEYSGFLQSGIIGGNFLRNYRLTFDFQSATLVLEPTKPLSRSIPINAIIGENIN